MKVGDQMSQKQVHKIPQHELGLLWQDFHEAIAIEPFSFGDERDERLDKAGLKLACIVLNETSKVLTTYTMRATPIGDAFHTLQIEEYLGLQPTGTQAEAINAIIKGEFEHHYGI